MKMKVEAVKYPEFNDNKAAGQKYAAREKTICIRGKNKNKIASLISMKKGQLRKQLDDAGAKPWVILVILGNQFFFEYHES